MADTGGGMGQRLWEIDLLRTFAICLMVAYHGAYNVDMLAVPTLLDPFSGGWRAVQVVCGSSFLFVTGVAIAVSSARSRAAGLTPRRVLRRRLRRAAEVAAAAALVSLATYLALGDEWVRFGVLHLIATAMVVGPLVLRAGHWLVPLAAAVLVGGLWLAERPPSDLPGAVVLGVVPPGGAGVDWYPLAPWLAPVLIGLWVGWRLYPGGLRGSWGRWMPAPPVASALGWPGRHALPIYLAHQPLLVPLVALALALAGVEIDARAFR